MTTTKSKVEIRFFTPDDWTAICDIRRPFYNGHPMLRDPDVQYYVSVREAKVTGCVGLKYDPINSKRALVVDLYALNARDWVALLHFIVDLADRDKLELSAWVSTDNKNIKYMERLSAKKVAHLIRREAQ